MNEHTLTLFIPTIEQRVMELEQCLASIHPQLASDVRVVVSGNGTRRESEAVARSFGAQFVHRSERLSALDHYRTLLREASDTFVWIVGDDDLVAPSAVTFITDSIRTASSRGLTAVMGKAQFFWPDDLTELSDSVPTDWNPGLFTNVEAVANATSLQVHHGTFIAHASLYSVDAYDRYRGTAHEIFGAFWDGLAEANALQVLVTDKTFVYLRMGEKAWDYSELQTHLGLKGYYDRLPKAVRQARYLRNNYLSRREALFLASIALKSDRANLRAWIDSQARVEPLAHTLALMPRALARFFQQSKNPHLATKRLHSGIRSRAMALRKLAKD